MNYCPMKISNTAFKSSDFILFKFVKYNVVTEELIPENFSIQYKLAKFFSIFGFVKFHSKSQSISFSLRMNTKSICRPSCNKIVAKCLVQTQILNGYVEDQNLTKSIILHSCNIYNKKFDNETDEKIFATKNFVTCCKPLDMVCLVKVKSLKQQLSPSISCAIDVRTDLDNRTLFISKLSKSFL